jgi:hypothetical protein
VARWIPQYLQDYILNEIATSTEQCMLTQQISTYYEGVRPPLWVTAHAYVTGDIVHSPTPNGKVYECTVGGTSGGTEPGWGTAQDQTFADGTVTWKTHNNYAIANRLLDSGDFTISDDAVTGGRKVVVSEQMGVVSHTAGIVSHCGLLCATDKSVKFVSTAQTTLGGNEVEAGRTTIFYQMSIAVADPTAT